jgi:hypothetical protein
MKESKRKLCRVIASVAATGVFFLACYLVYINLGFIFGMAHSALVWFVSEMTPELLWIGSAVVSVLLVAGIYYCGNSDEWELVVCVLIAVYMLFNAILLYLNNFTSIIPSWMLISALIFYHSPWFKFCNRFEKDGD